MPKISKTEIEKAARGLAAAGQTIDEVHVCPNGEVRFLLSRGQPSPTSRDVLDEIERELGKL